MVGECLVCAKIKDEQGLMKDKVGENCEYEVRFSLKKANEKMTKCTTNASNVVHLYHKSEEFVPQSEEIYYINVPQSEGHEKSTTLSRQCGKQLFLRFIPPTLTLR